MSASDRKAIRAAALAALTVAPRFAAMTQISAWAQSVDTESLPCFGVATPEEVKETAEVSGLSRRDLTLVLSLRRLGGDDIEDALDDDAEAAEAAIIAALLGDNQICDLRRTAVTVNGDGRARIGALTLTFMVTYWTDDTV